MMLNLSGFFSPVNLQDTPRLFTAIAEWLAVFVYFCIYKRKYTGKVFAMQCVLTAFLQILFQYVAGILALEFWIPAMIVAVLLMYGELYVVLDIKPRDCGVLTIHAFVLAEFAASLYTQIHVWSVRMKVPEGFLPSLVMMTVVYLLVFRLYYHFEKGNFLPNHNLNISKREFTGVFLTGVGAFLMSNLSFVTTNTPFSARENLLYVRTLVDFGGMLMLMTQMGRRNELAAKKEKDAINQLFQKQYEQYRLAMDNSEAMRKEIHDMKHYVLALKNENDPAKRAEVLKDMEQTIAIQESFMNTGNKVLDVILTTKSLQCANKEITLHAMADGEMLSSIHVKDICSLFGNMLDNAIEATQQVEEKERRIINLSVRRKNQFLVIECENCSKGVNVRLREDQPKRFFQSDHFPATTKKDNVKHGFGLKSISQVAEKYDGGMSCSFEDGWFKVRVLLPANL